MQKINLKPNSTDNNDNNDLNNSTSENSSPEPQVVNNTAATTVDENQEISQNQNSDQSPAVKPLAFNNKESNMKKATKKKFIVISVLALIAGTLTGFGAHRLQRQTTADKEPIQQIAGDTVQKGDVFGMHDSELFPDDAQGYLETGGINGEGSHRLLRVGGPSQTVYLTSTVTDLDRLVGMEVRVWGETYKGQVAGWLMDVGKVEVIEVEAQAPLEEEL